MATKQCFIGDLFTEKYIFTWLNSHHNVFWDQFMWIMTDKHTWIPVVIALFVMIFYKNSVKQSSWLLVCIVILATLSDQLSAGVIKPYFECLRPSHHPDFSETIHRVNDYRSGLYGFVSAHATNAFALAWFLSLVCRNKWLTAVILFWAIVNSYSRIYLGVHFVLDIVGGATLGTLIALSVYQLYLFGKQKIFRQTKSVAKVAFVRQPMSQYFAIFFISYIALIALYSGYTVG